MKKTYCDRCGEEIYYDPRQQAILPTYNISYATYGIGYQSNHFDLCGNCQIEFNSLMEKMVKGKKK